MKIYTELSSRVAQLVAVIAVTFLCATCRAEPAKAEEATQTVELADGKLTAEAPASWEVVEPRMRMIEREFSVAAGDGEKADAGRLTVMAAGGSVQQNIARWVGQFRGTEGGADRSDAKTDVIKVDGMTATLVDIAGTYMQSSGGPFGPKTPKENYRMLGAIIETGGMGTYFFKLVGPATAVDPAAEGFREMVASIEKSP